MTQIGCHAIIVVFSEISVFGQDTCVLLIKREFSLLCMFLNSYWSFVVDNDVVYLLRTVLAYLCGTKPLQVFIVIIAVTPVQSWSKAKGMCSTSEEIVGELSVEVGPN